MSNPKFYVGDLAGATYTMSATENASYPLSNLYTYNPSDKWKSSAASTGQSLIIDFGTAIERDFAVVDGLVSDGASDISIEAADNSSFTTNKVTAVASIAGASSPTVYTFAGITRRYWRILWTTTLGVTPEIGQIFINKAFDPGKTFIYPYSAKNEAFNSSVKRALDGTRRSVANIGAVLMFKMKFDVMDNTFLAAWQRFHQKVKGAGCPFYFTDTNSDTWYVALGADQNDVETFRYQLNATQEIALESVKVNVNPLT